MAAVRPSEGFIRYALSLQYHGASFLGFSYQGPKGEDCILPNGTDLRGIQSVEGRLRQALSGLVGSSNFENIQVSSRTDRGVHAMKNTMHVDIRSNQHQWDPNNIVHGLNFHLVQASSQQQNRKRTRQQAKARDSNLSQRDSSAPHEMRILTAAQAPLTMKNAFHTEHDDQPAEIDWNARFSATQRTYVYRILHQSPSIQYGIPFEWDRSWVVRDATLDIAAMQEAVLHLTGTHDYTSFRGNNCQRSSPIVTLEKIAVDCRPYDSLGMLPVLNSPLCTCDTFPSLVTIGIVGESFLYRQVRNIVGCLVQVGRGKLSATDVRDILHERNRTIAPAMAPAHGLFLVDVQHGDFLF